MPTSWEPWPGKSQATEADERAGRANALLFAKSWALDLHGLAPFVVPADRASVVRPPHGPAVRTAREAGQF